MRHQRAGKKLGRTSAHRKSLYANLAGALIEHGRIKTTEAKAKAVKPLAEQMVTLGRRGDLAARRQGISTPRAAERGANTRPAAGCLGALFAGRRAPALRRRRAALR